MPSHALSGELVLVSSRKPTGHGRVHRSPASSIHRLHRADCRHAGGPHAEPVTFAEWQLYMAHPVRGDDYLLCKVCRPEESQDVA